MLWYESLLCAFHLAPVNWYDAILYREESGTGYLQQMADPEHIMKDRKVSELTVSELQQLIKRTVQEAMAEVLIEINTIAEAEAELLAEAEIAEYLKASLQGLPVSEVGRVSHLDD